MALNIDEINNLRSSILRQRIRSYFVPMELTPQEIDKRTELAIAIYGFTNEMLKEAENRKKRDEEDLEDFLYAFYFDEYQKALDGRGLNHPDLSTTVGNIVATTVGYDSEYYTSQERAVQIALNESNSVFNYEDEQSAIREGKTLKTWLTMLDERVRETHAEVENVTVGINEFFYVGGYPMMRPMDDKHGAPAEERIGCRCVCKYTNKILQNADNGDNIHKEKDVLVHRSLGAKAVEYNVLDLKTFEEFTVVGGTKIQNVETFAGYGTNVKYNKAEFYAERYGGEPEKWQHTKGIAVLDFYGEYRKAEIHWSQCEDVGKFEFFVKEWLE